MNDENKPLHAGTWFLEAPTPELRREILRLYELIDFLEKRLRVLENAYG